MALNTQKQVKKRTRKDKVGRGASYKSADVAVLLDLVEEMLPLGQSDWDALTLQYNGKVSNPRESDQLRRKFKALKNVSKPTGDPTCPIEVKRAKRIHYLIEGKQDVQEFVEEDVDDDSSKEDLNTEEVNEEEVDDDVDDDVELDNGSDIADLNSTTLPDSISDVESITEAAKTVPKMSIRTPKRKRPTQRPPTTGRVGLTEQQLINSAQRQSPVTTTKFSIDRALKEKSDDNNMLHMMMYMQQRDEAHRLREEERAERRHEEERRREEEMERRRQEMERQRQEMDRRREEAAMAQQQMMMTFMMSMLKKGESSDK